MTKNTNSEDALGSCLDRFKGIELDVDSVINPKDGALTVLHSRITMAERQLDDRPTWKAMITIVIAILSFVGVAYVYSYYNHKDAQAAIQTVNDRSDKRLEAILKAIGEIKR